MFGVYRACASEKFTKVRSAMCMVVMKRPIAATFCLCAASSVSTASEGAYRMKKSDSKNEAPAQSQ